MNVGTLRMCAREQLPGVQHNITTVFVLNEALQYTTCEPARHLESPRLT